MRARHTRRSSLVLLLSLTLGGHAAGTDIAARQSTTAVPSVVSGQARATLERYFRLEEQHRFADIYAMMSARRRREFREKRLAASAAQYRRLRRESEASWSGFLVDGQAAEGTNKVVFTGRARVEETGEAEQVRFRCVMVREMGRWALDEWEY